VAQTTIKGIVAALILVFPKMLIKVWRLARPVYIGARSGPNCVLSLNADAMMSAAIWGDFFVRCHRACTFETC